MKETKISFKDLSVSLKILVIMAWIYVGFFVLAFIAGFVSTLMEV